MGVPGATRVPPETREFSRGAWRSVARCMARTSRKPRSCATGASTLPEAVGGLAQSTESPPSSVALLGANRPRSFRPGTGTTTS